jgi:hypothetical protein
MVCPSSFNSAFYGVGTGFNHDLAGPQAFAKSASGDGLLESSRQDAQTFFSFQG